MDQVFGKNMNMKKLFLSFTFFLFLTGCSEILETASNINNLLRTTPQWEKDRYSQRDKGPRLSVPTVTVSKETPEGELINYFDDGGVRLKTVVSNRCFDQYIEIYYQNGQLRTYTPMKNCIANGISKGYTQDGLLRTEITYVNGNADGSIKVYRPDGTVEKEAIYKDGYLDHFVK